MLDVVKCCLSIESIEMMMMMMMMMIWKVDFIDNEQQQITQTITQMKMMMWIGDK